MSRYIDADNIHPVLMTIYNAASSRIARKTIEKCDYELSMIPTADVAPVVHAHWEIIEHWATNDADKVSENIYLRCSRCRRQIKEDRCHLTDLKAKYPYCNCGAKMDEEVKGDEV